MDLIQIGMRVRRVRKESRLTQAEFGAKIGIGGPAVLNIETARNKKLQENTILLISKTFNVNYGWLMTGKGEMYPDYVNPVADRINDLLEGENETAKTFFRMFARFSDEDWELLQHFIDKLKKEENE